MGTGACPGIRRLFGPPGCGKTTALTERIRRAMIDFDVQVAVTSFTRTAAMELRGRSLDLPEFRVGTLHSMAYAALGHPTILETDKGALDAWNQQAPITWRIQAKSVDPDDPLSAEDGSGSQIVGESFRDYQFARSQLRWPEDEFLLEESRAFEAWKHENDVVDFTGLINLCLRQKLPPPFDVRAWFHDETQDSTPAELALLKHWGASLDGGLTLAGDDQQAIYGFRGATPLAFLEGEAEEHFLTQSYRLPETIRAFCHDYGAQMSVRKDKTWKGTEGEGSVVEDLLLGADRSMHVLEWIDAELQSMEDPQGSVMILASCGYMLHQLLKTLRAAGVPFHNPYRPERRQWNPSTTQATRRLRALLEWDEARWDEANLWIQAVNEKRAKLSKGTKRTIREMLIDEPLTRDKSFEPYVFEALAGDALPERPDASWFRENCTKTAEAGLDYAIALYEREGLSALSSKPRVIVGTVHSVKGGEADSVLLFPDLSRNAWVQRVSEDPDAILRVFYVGMTRAKKKLTLGGPSGRYFERWPAIHAS